MKYWAFFPIYSKQLEEYFIQEYREIILQKARAIKLIYRLTGVDIGINGNRGCVADARNKLQRAIIRQKLKSSNSSTRYDFNHHLALIEASEALSAFENKKPAPSSMAECR